MNPLNICNSHMSIPTGASCGLAHSSLSIFAEKYDSIAEMNTSGKVCQMNTFFDAKLRKRRAPDYDNLEDDYSALENIGNVTLVEEPLTRIVGGQEIKSSSIPHQVALRMGYWDRYSGDLILPDTSKSFCGGTLISEEWVLTAAHCLHGSYRSILVTTGHSVNYYAAAKREPGFQESKILQEFTHRQYRRDQVDQGYDIALIQLKNKFTFSEYVQPACLPPKDEFDPLHSYGNGENYPVCLISGWGDEVEGAGRGSSKLRYATIPLIPNRECNSLYRKQGLRATLPEGKVLCGGVVEGGIDTCQGDSGGPLTCYIGGRWTVTGVVSWGYGCATKGLPGAYSAVDYFRDWIHSTIEGAQSSNFPEHTPESTCSADQGSYSPTGSSTDAYLTAAPTTVKPERQCGRNFEGIEFKSERFYEMSIFESNGKIVGTETWFEAYDPHEKVDMVKSVQVNYEDYYEYYDQNTSNDEREKRSTDDVSGDDFSFRIVGGEDAAVSHSYQKL